MQWNVKEKLWWMGNLSSINRAMKECHFDATILMQHHCQATRPGRLAVLH